MSFADKINENKMIAHECLQLKAYNAGASRAYYAAFLAAKKFLTDHKFDYKAFLKKIREEKQREYSHGTIQRALTEWLEANGRNENDVRKLVVWDNLYNKRKRADYFPNSITERELRDSLNDIDTILSVLKFF